MKTNYKLNNGLDVEFTNNKNKNGLEIVLNKTAPITPPLLFDPKTGKWFQSGKNFEVAFELFGVGFK